MTLWLLAMIPTRAPFATSSDIILAPVYVLPAPGGPCTGRMPKSPAGRDAQRRLQGGFTRPADRPPGQARRSSRSNRSLATRY